MLFATFSLFFVFFNFFILLRLYFWFPLHVRPAPSRQYIACVSVWRRGFSGHGCRGLHVDARVVVRCDLTAVRSRRNMVSVGVVTRTARYLFHVFPISFRRRLQFRRYWISLGIAKTERGIGEEFVFVIRSARCKRNLWINFYPFSSSISGKTSCDPVLYV